MRRTIIVIISFLVAVSFASHSRVNPAGSTTHASKWELTSQRPNAQEEIVLGFALKQKNLQKLDSLFWSVSDPSSPLYGKYLSNEELAELVGGEDDTISTMSTWLNTNKAKSVKVSATKDYIWATFSHVDVESLLNIKLGVYVHNSVERNQRALITRSEDVPSIPSELASKLDFVSGVWHFPAIDSLYKKQGPSSDFVPRRQFLSDTDQIEPEIFSVEGMPGTVGVLWWPICSTGNLSEVIVNPCSDYGNAITTYTITTTQFDYTQNKVVTLNYNLAPSDPNYPNCTIEQTIIGSYLYCFILLGDLVNDAYVNITFNYCYEDGTCTSTVFASGGDMLPVVPSAYHNPNDIRAHYGIPTSAVGSSKNNSQAVAAFIMQFFSPSDLAQYFKEFDLPAYTVQNIVGPNDAPFPGVEASLDIQYIMGIAQGVNTWFWSMGGSSWVAEWAQAVINTPNAPWVHSISYGESEAIVMPWYLNRSETELQKLGVTGRSVMVASGDYGTGMNCTQPQYDISWPSSSPHVTSVGATRITRGATPECQVNPGGADCSTIGEVSASYDLGIFWTTGGGFSEAYSAPTYQQAAVNAYLGSANLPPQQYWNRAGRGYPDVSAVGHFLQVVDAGIVVSIDGTSAASPVFAGVVALLNEARIQAGKSSLGFLNPWLYQIAADPSSGAFYDVTVGDTTYCGGQNATEACCDTSFVAAQGWDPASGLGTPNFPALLKQAMTLP